MCVTTLFCIIKCAQVHMREQTLKAFYTPLGTKIWTKSDILNLYWTFVHMHYEILSWSLKIKSFKNLLRWHLFCHLSQSVNGAVTLPLMNDCLLFLLLFSFPPLPIFIKTFCFAEKGVYIKEASFLFKWIRIISCKIIHEKLIWGSRWYIVSKKVIPLILKHYQTNIE